jgi:D-arabinose 1-dehydrogenase-like Zn-dependent alcohol dehydrogenase
LRSRFATKFIGDSAINFFGAFGMQGQRYGTMLAMCESGALKPGEIVRQRVGLESVTDVLQEMGAYGTKGFAVIDRF